MNNDLETPKVSSRLSNTIRIFFIISFTAPVIFFFFQRQSVYILWEKVDQDYMKTIQVIMNSMDNINYQSSDRDTAIKIHITKYRDAKQILNINNYEVTKRIHNQSIFQDNKQFSMTKYKKFLIDNQIIEPKLLQIFKEIMIVEKYDKILNKQDGLTKGLDNKLIIKQSLQQLLKHHKQINYTIYKIKEDQIKPLNITNELIQTTYNNLIQKKHPIVFSHKEYIGYLIKKPIKSFKFNITDKDLNDFFIKNKNQYNKQNNLHCLILFNSDPNVLQDIKKNFEKHHITIEDIKKEYVYQEKIVNSLKDKDYGNYKNLFNHININKFFIQQYNNQYFSIIFLKEDWQNVEFKDIKHIIKNKVQEIQLKNILENNINELQKKVKLNSIDKSMKIYTIKNFDDPYETIKKGGYLMDNDNENVTLFILKEKINKKILPLNIIQKEIVNYIKTKHIKKESYKILEKTRQLLIEKKPITTELFTITNGLINLNDLENKNIFHFILTGARNIYYLHRKQKSIIFTNVIYSSSTHNKNIDNIIKDQFDHDKEIALTNKILYWESMNKHINRFIEFIKNIFNYIID